ncbi:MAG: MBL fold metallo-hydrolase [Spirosomataceae bacterium]
MLHSFTFSPIAENTYILWDESLDAVIIDPGCYAQYEKEELADFIADNKLKVNKILLTHAHLDHVFGVAYCKRKFGVDVYLHQLDTPIYKDFENRCKMWGFGGYEQLPAVDKYLAEGDKIMVGQIELDVVHVPGHAPGHVAFINHKEKYVIGGDVLFRGSIGRTDLPLCNHGDLIRSIFTKFLTLDDAYTVYAGHNEPTTIGRERVSNPFLR